MNKNTYNSFFNESHTTDKNLVEIGGRVVNKYIPNDKVAILTVTSGEGMKVNAISVVCFEEKIEKVRTCVNVGDFVYINGNIQSSLRDNGRITCSVFCDSILAESELNHDFYGTFPNKNRMYISGEITDIKAYPKNNCCIFNIKTFVNGHLSIFPVVFYNQVLPELNIHDRVSVIGNVQSIKKTGADGATKHFENYVAFQIRKEKCTELELSA